MVLELLIVKLPPKFGKSRRRSGRGAIVGRLWLREDAFTPDLNYHLDNEDKSEGDVNKVEKDNSEEVPAGHDADR